MPGNGLNIDDLQIQITATTNKAVDAINKLAGNLRTLSKIELDSTNIRKFVSEISTLGRSKGLEKVAKNLTEIARATSKLQTPSDIASSMQSIMKQYGSAEDALYKTGRGKGAAQPKTFAVFTEQIKDLNEVGKNLSGLNNIADALGRIVEKGAGLKDIGQGAVLINRAVRSATGGSNGKVGDMGKTKSPSATTIEKTSSKVRQLGKDAEKTGKEFDKAAKGGLTNFLSTVRRLATYRAIRAALKFLSEAIKEGFNMFVTWDREQNNFMAGTARNVDKLSEKWTMLKGQIGALGGALANAVVPIITWVVEGLTKMVDLLQMVVRSLQGEYSYYKLIYHEAKATTGQAKELKRVLFGFDELNILPSASGGGGSVSGGDWAYEEIPIDSKFLNGIADASNKIKDFLGLSDDAQNAIGGLTGVVGTLIGAKALGGLFGLLPKLITGFKQKNSTLSDQTSKVTSDATATEGLATKLGLALGAASAFSLFLKKNPLNVNVNKPQLDFSGYEKSISQAKQYAEDHPINIQVKKPQLSFSNYENAVSGAKQYAEKNPINIKVNKPQLSFANYENALSQAKKYAEDNPVNIQFGAVADLTGFARIAAIVASTPVPMSITLPIASVLTAAQSLRNTVQSWFNNNPWRIPVAVGKGAAQGGSKLAGGLAGTAIAGASAISRGTTVADVEKQIQDSMLNYESDLWHQGGTLGKVVGTLGGATLASVTTGGLLTGSVLSGGVLAELLGLLGFAGAFASGGVIPNTGSLFYAGEAGAEVVANMGHSTGVMNMSQMQEAVANGNIEVVNAVYAMANMVVGAVNNKNFDVYMDTQKVGQSVSKYQFNQARRGITQGAY